MPATGGMRFCGRFAVGNPSWRPSFEPCATRPEIVNGRPSSAPARARSPAASAARTAVDDVRSPVDSHRAHRFDAERPRRAAQRREVARTALAEAEILAHQQPARAEPAHEHGVDERLGLERREPRVEARDVGARHPARGELLDLVPDRGQPRRRRSPWRSTRAAAGRTSAPPTAARDRRRPRRAARASPDVRDGRRRNCRSSARSACRPRVEDREKRAPRVLVDAKP